MGIHKPCAVYQGGCGEISVVRESDEETAMNSLARVLACIVFLITFSMPLFACPEGYMPCGEHGQLCCPAGVE